MEKKPISVNVTARTFKNENFPNELFKYAKDIPAPLILEITERIYMDDVETSRKIIKRLKENKNVKIAIDDFGTGYSSLSYLKDIDTDILKIDMSFVRRIVEDEKIRAIVKAIITLAKDLNLSTLAEGVETKEQYEILKSMGVDLVQGFYFSKPLPENEAQLLI
ncbi:EAL domain-containing protein [Aquifex aeolicus]|uniref:EAL domain-containing protein n=1 Tax=Aquifex aeolicus (strain VF5) TaxID=224324 RepID=O66672_AQUAE|nr:EAL domain-containing protein [Aquifex aeolicus]AAC06635.1 hypothetical protein aq_341 [Aquifex aeolicus VF5]